MRRRLRWNTHGVWVAGSIPLVALALQAAADRLGANPVETVTHVTGEWALRWLWLCLAVTPARRWLGWSAVAPARRPLGLLAFGYASLHFATFLVLDLSLDLSLLGEELTERPYITAGFTGLVLMLPLALTSTRASIRRLGRRWVTLHRLVYLAAVAAVVHYAWLVKADVREPWIYAGVLAVLLAARIRVPPARRRGDGGTWVSSDRASA
ncbi:MAG: sulfite oxidase heme-binding subunit YedZ [Myxococcota bacterium]